jgi:hypothetical protein
VSYYANKRTGTSNAQRLYIIHMASHPISSVNTPRDPLRQDAKNILRNIIFFAAILRK